MQGDFYCNLAGFPICLPSCTGQPLSTSALTVHASGFWLLSWIPESAAWLPRQLILLFPGAADFLTDGIFINDKSRGDVLSNCSAWGSHFCHSPCVYEATATDLLSPWPQHGKDGVAGPLGGHWPHYLRRWIPDIFNSPGIYPGQAAPRLLASLPPDYWGACCLISKEARGKESSSSLSLSTWSQEE